MDSTNFFVPSAPLHDDPEQVKRQKSALRLDVQAIDATTQTGKINKYDVSLTGCSCRDFQLRKKPCKHMYRLAHELGVFHLSGKVINDNSVQNDADKKTKRVRLSIVCLSWTTTRKASCTLSCMRICTTKKPSAPSPGRLSLNIFLTSTSLWIPV